MKKIYLYLVLIITLQPILLKGQIIITEPTDDNNYYYIKRVVNTDTILLDSLIYIRGLARFDTLVSQQEYLYNYSFGYGSMKRVFGKYFDLSKYSIKSGKLEYISTSSVFAPDYKKLFDLGLEISFSSNGMCFRIPDKFYGDIVLPFDYFADQKKLDYFMKFLQKTIKIK